VKAMRKSYLSLVAVIVLATVFFFASISTLVFRIQPALVASVDVSGKTPTVNFLLYAGELSDSKFGFGFSPDTLSSPGPTLRFKTSDVVNITVVNSGKIPHAFVITSAPRTGAPTLFNSAIGSTNDPLQPGQSKSVIFSPNNAGSAFFYICPISGSAEAGMYGSIVIKTISGNGTGMGM
jgi:uncharacterized cupredoxin-like copper-binding protein